ncbi:MAG: DUF4403 family protein [Sphingobium sp.]
MHFFASALAICIATSGCSKKPEAVAPPRATDTVPIPEETSIIAIPVEMDQKAMLRAIEKAVPQTLWTIDQKVERCVPPQKVKLFGKKISVTPSLGCTIVGSVTRGPVTLHGQGQEIVADVPLNAVISARDVGGILKGETATGAAMAHARIRLDLNPDWTPRGTVRLHYDWTTPPGIDFLGQRITFTEKAEEKLAPIMRDLERTLPGELQQVDLRRQVEPLWRQSFTALELNRERPPVWMRVTPRRIIYSGYVMEGNRLRLDLGVEALTQTFVGPRPALPKPTALPPLARSKLDGRFRFFIPVIADYRELEPVILRALVKRSRRPFKLPGIGPVMARFDKVVAYGTTGNRIAVGLTLAATPAEVGSAETKGTIWISATPVNRPGSPKVTFRDLSVSGDTDGVGGDMLIALGNSPGVADMISGALDQNFARDLGDLLGKIRRAVERKQEGDFTIAATLSGVETGAIKAYGQGLYLPVRATGSARVDYRPAR